LEIYEGVQLHITYECVVTKCGSDSRTSNIDAPSATEDNLNLPSHDGLNPAHVHY
jgi:hypothetical protein